MGESMQDEWDEKTIVGADLSLAPPGRTSPRLIVLAGGNVGETHEIGAELTVGRGGDATLRVQGDGISRKHARVLVHGARVTLEDLGSTNGSFVNGTRVQHHALVEGDKIQIGNGLVLKFTYQDEFDQDFQRRMLESVSRDPLTQVYNKRCFLEQLASEVAFSVRHRSELSLMLLAVDGFAALAERHGQCVSDFVLREIAGLIVPSIRLEDVFARFADDTFALLTRSDRRTALAIAERLRTTVDQHSFVHEDTNPPVTVTVALESRPQLEVATAAAFAAAVETTLSEAQLLGHNRVVCSA